MIIFCLPFTPAAVPWGKTFSWSSFNYAPLVTGAVMIAVTVWYFGWARKTFKGPIRNVDLADTGDGPGDVGLADVAQSP